MDSKLLTTLRALDQDGMPQLLPNGCPRVFNPLLTLTMERKLVSKVKVVLFHLYVVVLIVVESNFTNF